MADQLQEMADTAVSDKHIDDQDLVRILRFINSVVAVVGQAFDDVLATLIELSYVGPAQLQEPRRSELLTDLDRVVQISRYKNVEEIRSRLHGLSEHYNDVIAPKLGARQRSAWGEVFKLLNEHEGKIILMVRDRVHTLHSDLASAKTADLPALRQAAEVARDEIQACSRGSGNCAPTFSACRDTSDYWNSSRPVSAQGRPRGRRRRRDGHPCAGLAGCAGDHHPPARLWRASASRS